MQIGILGAGAFGSALAKNLAFSKAKHSITLYCFEKEVAANINKNHVNNLYLPRISLPQNITATSLINDLYNSEVILLTIPVKYVRSTLQQLTSYPKNTPLIICSKGIEHPSGLLVSNIVSEALGNISTCVLTGPSFASEIANNLTSTLVLASNTLDFSKKLINKLSFTNIKLYTSNDIIGCQVGGAIKNIIAIASGIIKGLNMGHNALAGLITRGLNEIATTITAYGGNPKTAYGLSGLGDLVLTATSSESRNFSLGLSIAKNGGYTQELQKDKLGIAEGVFTTEAIYNFSQSHKLYLPICQEIYKILYCNKNPNNSISDILDSNIKSEF